MQDSVRSVTIAVKVDSTSQEIVITLSGQTTQPGAEDAYWAIAGLDMSAGHLIVPASSGIVLDQEHLVWGSELVYPSDWEAQMAVYETPVGSMVLYSTDSQYLRKQLRIASRSNPTIDLSIATEANGPWPSATSVPTVEWRLKSFAGDWRTAAAVYRDWLAANRPPVSNSNHAWVSNIRTVVQLGGTVSSTISDPSILDFQWPVPVSQPSAFQFSVGVEDSAGTCTDGVTFRVVVNGTDAWRQNVLHQGWVNGIVDLSAYAGTTVQLRIVTNPGPANNPDCDWASYSELAVTSLGTVTTSVPLVLGPATTVSGFSGSGTFSVGGTSAGTISGARVPGQFVLFLASGIPESAGTSLASLPFTTWIGSEGQLPVPATAFNSDFSFLPSGSVSTASSNGVTRQNAIFAHPPNEGRSILTWTLALPSRSNLQLGWSTGMGDGCLSDTGVQFSVRINGVTYWTLFQQAPVGWIPSGLDLTNWQGQNVLLQLVTDSVGDNGCDWAWWADLTISESDEACSITVPPRVSIESFGGSGSLPVTAGLNCPWSATTNVEWILISPGAADTGSGTVNYTVLPNTSARARMGTIRVAGRNCLVVQGPPRFPHHL